MKALIVHNGNSLNGGVMAMAVALRDELRRREPHAHASVLLDSSTHRTDAARFAACGMDTVSCISLRLLSKHHKLLPPLLLLTAPALLRRRVFDFLGFRFVRGYDAIVSLCGEDFCSDHAPVDITRFQRLIPRMARAYDRPFVFLAQSYGPFSRSWSRRMAADELSSATLITARDPISCERVRDVAPGADPRECADLAFLLEPTPWDDLRASHPECAVIENGDVLGVSVSRLFAERVLTPRGVPGSEARSRMSATLAAALDEVIEATGLLVVFVPHVVLPAHDDRDASERILAQMRQKTQAHVLHDLYTAPELKALLGRCHLVLACRMHAAIGSLSSNVPTLALAYNDKAMDLVAAGLGLKDVIDARTLTLDQLQERVAARLTDIHANHQQRKTELASRLEPIRELAAANVEHLLALSGGDS